MLIMSSHLPPLAALRALEAAARHRSFTRAADELNVTQSAISHQIRNLESLWGHKLFERGTRPLTLSKCGAEIVPIARDFFGKLSATLESFSVEDLPGPLKISTLESFALTWLVPRLGDFHEHYPEIDVWISTKDDLIDFSVEDVDLGIRFGNGNYPGLHSSLLFHEYVFPVCSTQLLNRLGVPEHPIDLARFPLLQVNDDAMSSQWETWISAAGVPELPLDEGSRFPNTNMALQAAVAGQGVALARSAHVDSGLSAAGLTRLFDVHCPATSAYYLVCPDGAQSRPRIAAFLGWIEAEAARSQQRYEMEMTSMKSARSGS
ncbi:transcriptional regulator GcvA [Roseibium album]|uniref:Gcv operon activator n=1 Tax=Roseibium album TaxID=311410 RepID=A0A0M6ZCU9_9HYPH|nr:transcriptional regulator GcvA [Roseibium album]MBG6166847.1 LysR family glycine cleavage system transcriptional activator [Labrenzia sp. EL_195]MBG6198884.1 LysR family glycine cleavage system transcriptional activator [Labrenzia sp. EL_13]CTQ60605.1 Gcv operon activator [Roseibium album]CTQ65557.1 Gcv operon activator [Roseibium album]CTQ73619.1 Gcv operon activator [Roseibium album]